MNHSPDFQQHLQVATNKVAAFDLSSRTQLRLTGPDRNQFLHNFCTNDILALSPGTATEAFLLNAKGRMLGYVFIFVGPDTTWVDSVPEQGAALSTHLERYHLLEEFQLENVSENRSHFYVTGPECRVALSSAFQVDWPGTAADRTWTSIEIKNNKTTKALVELKRFDLFDMPGFFVSGSMDSKEDIQQTISENGVLIADTDVYESLRIRHAVPDYGTDLSDENLAQEAFRTELAISFQKGCYMGQEPVARLNALGHVNRAITSFEIHGDLPLDESSRVVDILHPENSDKKIGEITSIAPSETQLVGLGILRVQFRKSNLALPLAGGGSATPLVD